jgi:hypothetical protein
MMKITTTTALARDAIRAVRESATGRGIAGPAALRLADAADVLIEDNERMRALLLRFREAAATLHEVATAQIHGGGDAVYLHDALTGAAELMSRIDAAIEEEK